MASPSRCRSSSPRGKGSGWTRGKGSIWNGPSRPVGPPVRVGRRRSGARKLHGMPTPGLHPGVRLSLRGRMMRSATRLDWLGTEQAYLVLGAARRLEAAGHQVVHLEIGEPDMPTPPHVVEAGVPELRDDIAQSLVLRGVRASAENVIVAPGAKPMLFSAALTLVEPGAEVLTPDPGFPIYESVIRFARVRARRGGHRRADHTAHPRDHPEPAAQPDRWGRRAGRPHAPGGARPTARYV